MRTDAIAWRSLPVSTLRVAFDLSRSAAAVAFLVLASNALRVNAKPDRCMGTASDPDLHGYTYLTAPDLCGMLWTEWTITVAAGVGLIVAVVAALLHGWLA